MKKRKPTPVEQQTIELNGVTHYTVAGAAVYLGKQRVTIEWHLYCKKDLVPITVLGRTLFSQSALDEVRTRMRYRSGGTNEV